MDKLFLTILNMSITSSYVILFVITARLLLKRVPKVFSYALWSVVLLRLIVPFSFESIFSLVPVSTQTVPADIMYMQTPRIQSGITVIDRVASNSLPTLVPGSSMNPIQLWVALGRTLWLLGIAAFALYSLYSIVKLHKRLKPAKLLYDNVYEIREIKTPFIFGFINPNIYLPTGLSRNERAYIIAHEQIHIKRFDHIVKLLAFFVACIHWFNPLVWAAYYFMAEDMELSCDESVIKNMGSAIKKDYSISLLSLSAGRHIIRGCPLAFGESNPKGRIKNILRYKKTAFWVIIVTFVAVAAIGMGLLSNFRRVEPIDGNIGGLTQKKLLTVEDYAYRFIEEEIRTLENERWCVVESKITKFERVASFDDVLPNLTEMWALEYRLRPDDLDNVVFAGGMGAEDGWLTEDSSGGKPILVFSYKDAQPEYLGAIRSGVAEITGTDLNSASGREIALREFLESRGLLPRETFAGDHILVKFPLSTGETCQLFLSQPATRGDHGIWCVERWMDGNGSVYYVTPKTDGSIKDYYKNLQHEADNGHKPGLMDPLQVALHWINDDLGQHVTAAEIRTHFKYSATAEDFLKTPESRYIGFISDFETENHPKYYFHLYPIEWLTEADTERLKELGIGPDDMPNGFYIYRPHEYPMFFQVTEDTLYNIIQWGEQIAHRPITVEEFIKYLETYSGFIPPFHVVTKDGYVKEITEQYVP